MNKFGQKKESRRSNAFKFLRRPSSSTIIDTVSKVADKAVNIVDNSFNSSNTFNTINENPSSSSSTSSILSSSQSFMASLSSLNNDHSLIEFKNVINRVLSSPSSSSSTTTETQFSALLLPKTSKNKHPETVSRAGLVEFEKLFSLNFPQLNQDLSKRMKLYVEEIKKKDLEKNGLKLSEEVQEFYKRINKYMLNNASIKAYLDKLATVKSSQSENNLSHTESTINNNEDSEKLHETIMIMVESYITNNIYDHVFPAIMSEFEEQDMNLQNRIRNFYWITNEMIGTCIDENSVFYRDTYEEALNC